MTDKELRRLRRVDLLEMLVEQSRELERVRAELARVREELADRRLVMEECGSIAEASLELNRVFEAAQAAADQYVENVRRAADARAGLHTRVPVADGRHVLQGFADASPAASAAARASDARPHQSQRPVQP